MKMKKQADKKIYDYIIRKVAATISMYERWYPTMQNKNKDPISVFPFSIAAAIIGNNQNALDDIQFSDKFSPREMKLILATSYLCTAYNLIREISINSNQYSEAKLEASNLAAESEDQFNLASIHVDLINMRNRKIDAGFSPRKTQEDKFPLQSAVEKLLESIEFIATDLAETASDAMVERLKKIIADSPIEIPENYGKIE